MTKVFFYKKNDEIIGFKVSGHTGYDVSGKDIVCAAVSTLTINTVNSLDAFSKVTFELHEDEKTGVISLIITSSMTDEARLLLKSMELGLKNIKKEVGSKYIHLYFEEV